MFGNIENRRRRSKWQIDLALHGALEAAGRDAPAFQRLLRHVQQVTQVLRAAPVGGRGAWQTAQTFVSGLWAIAAHQRHWLREVESWEPAYESPWFQFRSLAHHLFAKRRLTKQLVAEPSVPEFMYSAWFEGRSHEARRHQKWFLHLALGYGIRGVTTPIALTKTMARYFAQAPRHRSVNQAIRWCQVRGLGGDAALADAIVATQLGQRFEHEEYWLLAIRFLIDNPYLGAENVEAILEYLRCNRRLCRCGPFPQQAKRKAAEEFLRRVRKWRAEPARSKKPASLAWKPSGIGEFDYRDERRAWNLPSWNIRELLDDNELREEGRSMRHCVGNYASECARAYTTIWSLTRSDQEHQCRRELTLEVNPKNRRIVQAKGIRNSKPTLEARRITLLWAKARGLDPRALE